MSTLRAKRSSAIVLAFICLAFGLAWLPLSNALIVFSGALLMGALFLFPEIAVYFLVFAVPFGSLLPLDVGGAQVTAADFLLVVAWASYLARGVARRKLELRFPPLALPFVLFIFAAGISLTVARSFADSLTELAKWIEMFAAYWLVAQFFHARARNQLLGVMFGAGLAEALLGAYQYYFRLGPEGFLLFGGANLRAYGTFEQPNPYAGYLGLILPLAFGTGLGLLWQRARKASELVLPHLVLFFSASLAFLFMLAALFFSYSRGAWLASAAALGATALLILTRSKRATTFVLAAGVLAFIVIGLGEINLIPNIVSERFATVGDYFNFEDVRGVRANDENYALVERRAHWQAALSMFQDSPWVGVGFGNYAAAYPQYALPKWDDALGHAHNYYLNVLAEAGGLGFLAYAILWGAIFWHVGRAALRAASWERGLLAGAFGALLALSIHNFFDNLFVHAMYLQVGLTLGIVETLVSDGQTVSQTDV